MGYSSDSTAQANMLWSDPHADTLRPTRGPSLYNSRLFALLLCNPLTPDFAALLYSCLDNGHITLTGDADSIHSDLIPHILVNYYSSISAKDFDLAVQGEQP